MVIADNFDPNPGNGWKRRFFDIIDFKKGG